MNDEKWYYEITETDTKEKFLMSIDLPVKAEKICEMLGLTGYTAVEVTKEYYEENADE